MFGFLFNDDYQWKFVDILPCQDMNICMGFAPVTHSVQGWANGCASVHHHVSHHLAVCWCSKGGSGVRLKECVLGTDERKEWSAVIDPEKDILNNNIFFKSLITNVRWLMDYFIRIHINSISENDIRTEALLQCDDILWRRMKFVIELIPVDIHVTIKQPSSWW